MFPLWKNMSMFKKELKLFSLHLPRLLHAPWQENHRTLRLSQHQTPRQAQTLCRNYGKG